MRRTTFKFRVMKEKRFFFLEMLVSRLNYVNFVCTITFFFKNCTNAVFPCSTFLFVFFTAKYGALKVHQEDFFLFKKYPFVLLPRCQLSSVSRRCCCVSEEQKTCQL